jgi:GT2 family glycosyltransferase
MDGAPSVAVVVCCFTEDRWDDIAAAIASVRAQTRPADEFLVVVDHSQPLAGRLRRSYPDLTVIENGSTQGLSGARNTGVEHASADVVAFLDDDAVAEPTWLEALCRPYEAAEVVAVGGRVDPRWDQARPSWFPAEFDWVVGCTYIGHAPGGPVRNVIGANMSFRRDVILAAGGFDDRVGRVGRVPSGCEETELCIRAQQQDPAAVVWYEPAALVTHRVRPERATFAYFAARCRAEGGSKAAVAGLVGRDQGLSSERNYVSATLPRACGDDFVAAVRGRDVAGIARIGARVAGVLSSGWGYGRGKVGRARVQPVNRTAADFEPALVLSIDCEDPGAIEPVASSAGAPYGRARLLVRDRGRPAGRLDVDLPADGLSAPELEGIIQRAIRDGHLQRHDSGGPERADLNGSSPHVTVVIATMDRPEMLRRCLESVLRSRYPSFDLLVVENHATSTAGRDVVEAFGPRVRWVREERPGLANAHNRALQEPTGPILAFTDDDVVVDEEWIAHLVDGFTEGDDVGCVTGLIFPLELETPSQDLVERSVGFDKGYSRQVFRAADRGRGRLFPYAAGAFGSGANMAFRVDVLRAIGGFDPSLGTGTPALGGDDLAAFFDVVAAGYTLVYEPAAVIFHAHRREEEALARQAYGYGAGLTAYLTRVVVERPSRLLDISRRLPSGLRYGLSADSAKNAGRPVDYPRALVRRERVGMLVGPARYLQSRRRNADARPVNSTAGPVR